MGLAHSYCVSGTSRLVAADDGATSIAATAGSPCNRIWWYLLPAYWQPSADILLQVFEAVLRENSCLESLPTTNSLYSTLDIIKAKNESEAARSFSGSLL
jgi:hypothetical protein